MSIAPEAFPTLYSFAQRERVVANSRINPIRGHEQPLFEHTEPDSDERLLQFELITDDLTCTKPALGSISPIPSSRSSLQHRLRPH